MAPTRPEYVPEDVVRIGVYPIGEDGRADTSGDTIQVVVGTTIQLCAYGYDAADRVVSKSSPACPNLRPQTTLLATLFNLELPVDPGMIRIRSQGG